MFAKHLGKRVTVDQAKDDDRRKSHCESADAEDQVGLFLFAFAQQRSQRGSQLSRIRFHQSRNQPPLTPLIFFLFGGIVQADRKFCQSQPLSCFCSLNFVGKCFRLLAGQFAFARF